MVCFKYFSFYLDHEITLYMYNLKFAYFHRSG